MTNDDHAALIEVKGRLMELHAQQKEAESTADLTRLLQVQAEIDAADAMRIEIMRRTEPEDEPRL